VYDIEYTLREVDDLYLPRIYKESLKVSIAETKQVAMGEDNKKPCPCVAQRHG
jgi:hypothetical protein